MKMNNTNTIHLEEVSIQLLDFSSTMFLSMSKEISIRPPENNQSKSSTIEEQALLIAVGGDRVPVEAGHPRAHLLGAR